MALNSDRSLEMASDIEASADALKMAVASLQRTLATNTALTIDWSAASTPSYIEEDSNGNIAGKRYSRQQVSNVIFSLEQTLNLLTNIAATQGDHLGNINQIALVSPTT